MLNVLNRQNQLSEYWDSSANAFRAEVQNPFILVASYRIQF
jgi:hypothetical protein